MPICLDQGGFKTIQEVSESVGWFKNMLFSNQDRFDCCMTMRC